MQQIAAFFWRMCLLRAEPARTPASAQFLVIAILLQAIVVVATLLLIAKISAPASIVASVCIELSIKSTGVWLLLRYKNVTQRFFPTLTAIFVTNSLITTVFLLLVTAARGMGDNVVTWLQLFAWLWTLAVAGFIFNRALSVSILQGAALLLAMDLTYLLTFTTFFPQAPP